MRSPEWFSILSFPRSFADTWLEINLENIAWNLAQIRKRIGNRPVMAVVKANTYGHGLVEVGKFLEKQNISYLAVGKFQEALDLRKSGVNTPTLNLGMFFDEQAEEIILQNISQSIFTDDYKRLAQFAQKHNSRAKIHIKVDTGLGRVGVPYHKSLPLIEKIAATDGIEIAGIFTPFTEDDAYDKIQLLRLLEICEVAKKKGIDVGLRHAASSAGVISFPEGYLDMVRPGIAIYGQYPSTREYEARKIDLRPACR
ncbi:MAG: alanine racemase [bacterium]